MPAAVSRLNRVDLPAFVYPGQRDQGSILAAVALDAAGALDLLEIRLELLQADPQDAAVLLELALSLATAGADAAPLAGDMAPLASQAGEHVPEPGELDLRARLAALRPEVEDVQDQGAAVHDQELGELREVLGLAARQVVVEDQQLRTQLARGGGDLLGLSLADGGRRVRCLSRLHGAPHDLGPRRVGELRQLVEMLLDDVARLARQDEAHQERPPGAFELESSRLCNVFGLCCTLGKTVSRSKTRHFFNIGATR